MKITALVLGVALSLPAVSQELTRQTYIGAQGQVIGTSTSFDNHSTYFGAQGQYVGESTRSTTAPIGVSGYGTPTRSDDGYQVPSTAPIPSMFERLILER